MHPVSESAGCFSCFSKKKQVHPTPVEHKPHPPHNESKKAKYAPEHATEKDRHHDHSVEKKSKKQATHPDQKSEKKDAVSVISDDRYLPMY
jgi:hypothetical protein